ncbi:MBL fold metallo-hydrolase [Halobaculum sp. MBLA0143]|uniref:MBL fold metallo-hydrolase n=1 Tax=Halobaculum sp. MBLA0143 TaxID=3079933 RepID=UPI0035240E01
MDDTPDSLAGDSVTAETLARALRDGASVSVLDLRDRDEFEAWGVDAAGVTARQVPHVEFVAAGVTGDPLDPLPDDLADPVVVVCARGAASDDVAATLREHGRRAVNLVGGTAAYAETLLATDLPAPTGVTVRQYQRPASGCLSYLVAVGGDLGAEGGDSGDTEADGDAVVVDPLRAFVDRYRGDAAGLGVEVRTVVDTHVHADHVSGVPALAAATGATPAVPAGATERGLDATPETRLLEDGDTVAVGDRTLRVRHTPGHTHEHVALVGLEHLFSGDALFTTSVGRPDLEAGAGEPARDLAAAAYDSLHDRLLAVPDHTVLAPGHAADVANTRDGAFTARVGDLGFDLLSLSRGAFVDAVSAELPPRPSNFSEIVATNLGRRSMDDDHAFEAELGPNNCAVAGD